MPAAWVSAAVGAVSLISNMTGGSGGSNTPSGQQVTTQQQQLDPRMQGILYGNGQSTLKPGVKPTYGDNGRISNPASDYTTNNGILGGITGLQNQPENAGLSTFNQGADNYLGNNGYNNMNEAGIAANQLMKSSITTPVMGATSMQAVPGMQGASMQGVPGMQGASVNAPSQNGLDLSGAYNSMINGNAGANPYLTSALQSGVDQTNAAYQANQTSATNNLMRNVLPGIRSGAMAVGGYGGSREGIAEGNALGDYTNQLNNSNLQLGLANSANTTSQQANAFNQGQDRSLSAMSGLGAQQYGVAGQNASNQQQANAANYQGALGTSQFNAGNQQAANAANYQGGLLTSQVNDGNQQATNLANQQADLSTHQLNSANAATGINANQSVMQNAYTMGNNANNYQLNRTGQISGLLTPFTGLGGTQTNSSPLYSNPLGSAIGGATAGLGLYQAYQNATKNQYVNDGTGTGGSQYSGYDTIGNGGWGIE